MYPIQLDTVEETGQEASEPMNRCAEAQNHAGAGKDHALAGERYPGSS